MNNAQKNTIVDTVNLISISSMVSFLDKYPILKEILKESKNPSNDWDFYMTAAGSGIVLISSETYKGEHDEIKNRASEIDKDIPRAIDDFISFMNKGNVSDDLIPANIGLWVLWNLKQAEPSNEEVKELAPVIGNFLLQIIFDWRKSKN